MRNDVFAEIEQVVVEALHQNVAIEEINSHRSLKQVVIFFGTNGTQELATHLQFLKDRVVLRFFDEAHNAAIDSALHNAELCDLMSMDRFGCESNVGAGLNMLMQQCAKIHPIKLIAAENEIVIERVFEEVAHVLADGIGGALIPLRTFRSLLRGQNVDEAAREIVE